MHFYPAGDYDFLSDFWPFVIIGVLLAMPIALSIVRRRMPWGPTMSSGLRAAQWAFGTIAAAIVGLWIASWWH